MLQEPDVAHNFLYRDPDQGSAVQAFCKYFVATELHVRAKPFLYGCTHVVNGLLWHHRVGAYHFGS